MRRRWQAEMRRRWQAETRRRWQAQKSRRRHTPGTQCGWALTSGKPLGQNTPNFETSNLDPKVATDRYHPEPHQRPTGEVLADHWFKFAPAPTPGLGPAGPDPALPGPARPGWRSTRRVETGTGTGTGTHQDPSP